MDKFLVPTMMFAAGIGGDIYLFFHIDVISPLHIGILVFGGVLAFFGLIWAGMNLIAWLINRKD